MVEVATQCAPCEHQRVPPRPRHLYRPSLSLCPTLSFFFFLLFLLYYYLLYTSLLIFFFFFRLSQPFLSFFLLSFLHFTYFITSLIFINDWKIPRPQNAIKTCPKIPKVLLHSLPDPPRRGLALRIHHLCKK